MPKRRRMENLVQEFQVSRARVLESLRASAIKLVAPESLSLSHDQPGVSNSTQSTSSKFKSYGTRPGDIILVQTPGSVYKIMRNLADHEYDHAVVVVHDNKVVHVSPPCVRLLSVETVLQEARKPLVLRPVGADVELFVSKLSQIEGAPYGVRRLWGLVIRRAVIRFFGMNALPPLPFRYQTSSSPWICTDAIVDGLLASSAAIQQAVTHIKPPLDYTRLGVASLEDLVSLAKFYPSLIRTIPTKVCPIGDDVDEANPNTAWLESCSRDCVWVQASKASVHESTGQYSSSLLSLFGSGGKVLQWFVSFRDFLLSSEDWATLENFAQVVLTQVRLFSSKTGLDQSLESAWESTSSHPLMASQQVRQVLYVVALLILFRRRSALVSAVTRIIQTLLLRRLVLDASSYIRAIDPLTLQPKSSL